VNFEDVLVIVGGGMLDDALLRTLHASGARLVGADGGADRIAAAGLMPELIVGDMDSLADPASWAGKARLLRITEQETTDFEKAIYSTQAPVTIALGMMGKRLDHTLAALDAVSRYAATRKIILVDEHDLALALTEPFSFSVAPGERVSVHPLAPVTFAHSDGLQYPLDALTLAPGMRTGTSNAAVEGTFSIVPEEGTHAPWLLILDNRYLLPLIDALKSG
jgi:thiamine pyrophosphokinase